jgi:hypothetical protein
MADNTSPEEKLFKVIQELKSAPPNRDVTARSPVRAHPAALKARFDPALFYKGMIAKAGLAIPAFRFHEIELKTVNSVLIAILGVIVIFTAYQTISNRPDVDRVIRALSSIHAAAPGAAAGMEVFKPAAFYVEEVRKRDIFAPVTRQSFAAISTGAKTTAARLREMAKDIKLKGIAWGKSPKAIIKDEKEGSVYFLEQGQTIGSTGIEIKEILQHKIVISRDGEEMELS